MKEGHNQSNRTARTREDTARREHIEELRDEYEIVDRIDEEYERAEKKRRNRIIRVICIIAVLLAVVLLILLLQTYDAVQVLRSQTISDAGSNGYAAFGDNILKYNRDGASLMDTDGEDKWNQAMQMQQPVAAVSDHYAVVADVTGTAVYLFDEKGLVSQVQTGKPVERAFVGDDGTIAVIQENGSTPVVSCYDREGAPLLKHQAALNESGYPISAALSEEGDTLLLSYLQAGEKGVSGKVAFYDLTTQDKDNTLFSEDVEGEACGEVFFMDDKAVAVGESQFIIYGTGKKPKQEKTVELEGEIEKVFRSESCFGFVLRLPDGERKVTVYTKSGGTKLEKTITGIYDRVTLTDKQVILYSGQECCIYTLHGIHRFDGQMPDGTLFVMPLNGINRYAVITNDGINTVYLTR